MPRAASMMVCIAMPIDRWASSRCSWGLPSWNGPIQLTRSSATSVGALRQ